MKGNKSGVSPNISMRDVLQEIIDSNSFIPMDLAERICEFHKEKVKGIEAREQKIEEAREGRGILKDQLISFETAKAAKEKGLVFETEKYWANYYTGEPAQKWKLISAEDRKLNWMEYPAPTQSLLQKCLRDQKILVEVTPIDSWDEWSFIIMLEDAMSPFFVAEWNDGPFKSYEEALEQGLKEALDSRKF